MSINSISGSSAQEMKSYIKKQLHSGTNPIDLLDRKYLANNEYGLPEDSSCDILYEIFEDDKTMMDFSVSDSEFADDKYHSFDGNGNSLYYKDGCAVIKINKTAILFLLFLTIKYHKKI